MVRASRRPAAKGLQSSRAESLARAERPQGVRKEARPLRRSTRLAQQHHTAQQAHDLLLSRENNGIDIQAQPSASTQPADRKRKRARPTDTSDRPVQKRRRASPSARTAEDAYEETASGSVESDSVDSDNPIDYWRKHQRWPRKYFDSGGSMLARKKSFSSLRRRASATSISSSDITPSDRTPREAKSAPYQSPRYLVLLETRGSFMSEYVGESESGPVKRSIDLCRTLLETEQDVPQDSLFSSEFFEKACRMIENRNEAKVIQDIARLIVPSAQSLGIRGGKHLKPLFETVNETWSDSMSLVGASPKPDYSVGFRWSAFTAEQLKRLKPWLGDVDCESIFKATCFMYFPFLTCEVKCGTAALDIADRQNAHSMTLAVRAIVELFRLVKREKEIDREILAFSVSHDTQSVRIYGHYPVIDRDGKDTKYYRHLIHNFNFTVLDGKDRWTAYKFTKNVYDNWVPDHFKRICSAIDEIPLDFNFDAPPASEVHFSGQAGRHSEEFERRRLSQSEDLASPSGDGSSIISAPRIGTPDTSISQSFKRPKRKR